MSHMFSFTAKLKTVCLVNSREHYRVKAKRVAFEREEIGRAMRGALSERRPFFIVDGRLFQPVLIKMTRVAPSKGLDDDNLYSALKGVRDSITEVLGLKDDSNQMLRFEVSQRTSTKRQGYSVEVSICPYHTLRVQATDIITQYLAGKVTSQQVEGLGNPKLVGGRIRLDCGGTVVDVLLSS
jgi:hypothetical protein